MSKLVMISRVRGSDPRIMIKNLVIIWLFWDQNIPGWILSENPGTKENRKSLELVPEDCESVRKSSWTWNQLLQEFWSKKTRWQMKFWKKEWKNCSQLTCLINWAEYCSDSQRSSWQSNYLRSSIEFCRKWTEFCSVWAVKTADHN